MNLIRKQHFAQCEWELLSNSVFVFTCDKDNVHWFTAESDHAFIFNIHVLGTNPENPNHAGRVYVDPIGEKLSGGLIKAPRLTFGKVNQLYG